ncbi:MAG: DUF5777 family beta-barrel protein [Bacteroidota bacterium]
MKKIYKILTISSLVLLTSLMVKTTAFAQEEGTAEATKEVTKERPVRPAFESGLLFDAATTTVQPSKTLEMIIQHRFGYTENGIHDLYGIWNPANIRFGLNYSILNNLTIGAGATKFNKMEDFQLKYRFVEQTRSNSMPITVMLYEVVAIDGSPNSKWDGTPDSATTKSYKFSNRMSYFTQLVISRRFNDHLSLQIAPGFTHYNVVDSVYNHDRMSFSFAGRYKFSPQGSIIISCDFPLDIKGLYDFKKVSASTVIYNKPNICVGFEVSTSTHTFHIYLASAQGILPQEDIMWNKKNFFDMNLKNPTGSIMLGLNITRLWNF